MSDLTMWKTVGANEKNIIQPMSAEGIKQLRDLLTYLNDVRGPGLAYFSPERALALIAAYDAAEARAEKAEADAKEWKEQIPEECPITGLPYFSSFKNSAGVYQPFYGGPCDVYGIPYKDEDGYLCRKHLCLDSMREEDENMCLQVVEEERMIDLGEAEAKVARLLAERDWLVERCAELCEDDEHYPDSRKQRVAIWKESARRAVEGK